MHPIDEYQKRLTTWNAETQLQEKRHLRVGNWRIVYFIGLLVLAAILCQSRVALGWVLLMVMAGLFVSGMIHDRILNARDLARLAARFYQAGIDRLTGKWAGKGSPGTEFLDPRHPYAGDLDIFGKGSLYELLNAAQTRDGRALLADWLLHPASPEQIRARQTAVNELRPKLDFRERVGLLAAEAETQVRTDRLIAWSQRPLALKSKAVRGWALALPLLNAGAFGVGVATGQYLPFIVTVVAQSILARTWRGRVRDATRTLGSPARDLKWLAGLLRRVEEERFETPRLRELQAACVRDGIKASEAIGRLARLYDWLESRQNIYFTVICGWLLWEMQFAFAVEAWRARFGPAIEPWVRSLAELEALSSLAGYAYEHPADVYPDLREGTSPMVIEAEGLGHPLIPDEQCVRNDLRLGADRRLVVISGSNMSGKSTYMRAIGVNVVLAQAGAPVRAKRFALTPVQIGASFRTMDSLQEGVSRFYAEITRLRDVLKLTEKTPPLLFLLDEILGGTNSHDRRVGAAAFVKSLIQHGALGLITTHDLALTAITSEIQPSGANFHFEDQMSEGRMSFDYQLRPGVVEKSNALELMRSVGLEV